MSDYVSKVDLEVNGTKIEDFKSVSFGERELRKQVNLMNKTGHMKMTSRETFKLDYVVPKANRFDFTAVEDGTVRIVFDDGKGVSYLGVHTLKIGETQVDGDNEVVQTIEFGAVKRVDD